MTHKKLRAAGPTVEAEKDTLELFQKAVGHYLETVKSIFDDRRLLRSVSGSRKPLDDWRRIYIRQCFAEYEVIVYQMGRILLAAHEAHLIQLCSADFLILSGVQYRLRGDGETELRNDPIHLNTNLLFMVRLCGDYCGSVRTVNKRASDWKNYKIASRINDRLSRPREFSDYEITDHSLLIVTGAFHWIDGLIKDLNRTLGALQQLKAATAD